MSFLGKFRAILLFGPPGSGKGSVGKVLSFLKIGRHISSGDIFRSLSPDSKEGKLFREQEKQGLLVADEVSIAIFRNYLQKLIDQRSIRIHQDLLILDGIPRTEKQVDLLQEQMQVEKIFYLHVKQTKTLAERIAKRAKAQKRADDQNPTVIETRIREYEEKTAQILQKYPASSTITVFADNSLAHVCKDVLNHLLQ